MNLTLCSEPFTAMGNIAGEGLKRLLGRPPLGLLQTFLREGIQNVIDASVGSAGPRILVRIRTLDESEAHALRAKIFYELPHDPRAEEALRKCLRASAIRVLELCDFNTIGLAGPTRADEPLRAGEPQNFVNFLRNVGAARGAAHTGGTYGYGKSSLYAMSKCSTILVDSETTWKGKQERRLMACHLGGAFEATQSRGRAKRFTGRHWWGVASSDDEIGPVTGKRAARLAEELGMEGRGEERTGTSIVVLDPRLELRTDAELFDEITETILWNFWPRMMRSTPSKRRLNAEIHINGTKRRVSKPEDVVPFSLMAEAMATIRAQGSSVIGVHCGAPRRKLGSLAIAQGIRHERTGAIARESSTVPKQLSHIALMRPVELVVKYVEGDALADARFEWAGVFICSDDPDVESAFASAEPPAHDDWIPNMLDKGHAKTFVNVALRRINEVARSHATPIPARGADEASGPSLATSAIQMGKLLGAVSGEGPGPGPRSKQPREPGQRKGLSVSAAKFVRLEESRHGQPIAVFSAELRNDGTCPSASIVAEGLLMMDGGTVGIEDLPDGFMPSVIRLEMPDAKLSEAGRRLEVGAASGKVKISVSVPSNAAVTVRLTVLGDPRDEL